MGWASPKVDPEKRRVRTSGVLGRRYHDVLPGSWEVGKGREGGCEGEATEQNTAQCYLTKGKGNTNYSPTPISSPASSHSQGWGLPVAPSLLLCDS